MSKTIGGDVIVVNVCHRVLMRNHREKKETVVRPSLLKLACQFSNKNTSQGKTCHIFQFTLARETCQGKTRQGKLAGVNGA